MDFTCLEHYILPAIHPDAHLMRRSIKDSLYRRQIERGASGRVAKSVIQAIELPTDLAWVQPFTKRAINRGFASTHINSIFSRHLLIR